MKNKLPDEFKTFPSNVGRGPSFLEALYYLRLIQINKNTIIPRILETGTSRGKYGGGLQGDGHATIAWGWYAKTFKGEAITIDIEKSCINDQYLRQFPF